MFSARRADLPLLVVTLVLVTIGLGMLYSTSAIMAQDRYDDSLYFLKRQLTWSGLGLVAMWIAASVPYPTQRRMALPTMGFVLLLLVVVLVVGKKVGGAQRWLTLGPFSFQPSELAKYVLIMYVARVLAANSHRPESPRSYIPAQCHHDGHRLWPSHAAAGSGHRGRSGGVRRFDTAHRRRAMAISGAHGRRDVAIPLVQIVFRRLQPQPCAGLSPTMEGPTRYRLSDRPGSQGAGERRLGRRWAGTEPAKTVSTCPNRIPILSSRLLARRWA